MPRACLGLVLLAWLTLAPAAGAQEDPLTVMSFNIRYGTADDGSNSWPGRSHLVMQVIREHHPDVLGLQEALRFQLDEMAAALPGYAQAGVGRDDGATRGEYAALLYRTDRFLLGASGTFWLSDEPETIGSVGWGNRITRICTWVRLVERSSGQAFWVYNVHFDHESPPARARSAELVASRLAARAPGEPAIVLGDFNAAEDTPPMQYLRGERARASDAATAPPPPGLRDTFRAIRPGATGVGTFHGFQGTTDGGRIDAILVTEAWSVADAAIVRWSAEGRYPSDHYPVVAVLSLPGR